MSAVPTLNEIFASTLSPFTTTAEPSFFGEHGVTILIIVLIVAGILSCCLGCTWVYLHQPTSNSVLPTQAPSVTQSRPIINPKKGQPILKTYKPSTRSTLSGESVHTIPSRSNASSSSNYQQHRQQQKKKNTNPFYNSQIEQHQQDHQSINTNPFYDIPLDTESAPRQEVAHDNYSRQGPRRQESTHLLF